MSKLRVAHIITQLEVGGAQRNTLYTIANLNREQYEPFLICGLGGILTLETKQGNWPTYFVQYLARPVHPLKDTLAFIELYRRLREIKPHIVHTHSSKAGILGRLAAYFAGVPVIIHTFHGFGFTPKQKPFVRRFFIKLEKTCARLSTHLIFVSEANRSEAKQLGIGRNVPNSLIRSGIQMNPGLTSDPASLQDYERRQVSRPGGIRRKEPVRIRKKFEIPEDAWVVAYVGNFKPQKNPMDLARTAAIVLQKNPEIHFILVGDGELRPSVTSWVQERQIQNRVHFLKWKLRRNDVERIFTDSNCFLLTSLWEGLPRSLVEAFAACKPAVAYGVDGVRDILQNEINGFQIPPGNVDLAAEKILWLADNKQKAIEMGQNGRRLILKEFDIDTMVRQQEILYQELYEAVPLKSYYEPLWSNPSK